MGLSSKQVSSDEFNWSQDLLKNGVLEMPKPVTGQGRSQQQQQMAPLKCPRCDSTNTKFCYYNNYSRSQPRHLCKACRRHWTAGGNLRNVPVGGGRKTKRPKTTNTNSTTSIANNVNQGTSTFQHLHQQPVLSFGEASERSIFPDVFRRVVLQPSQTPPPTGHSVNRSSNSFMGSLVSPPFPTQFAGIAPAVTSSYDSIIGPFSVTSSSSSSTFVPEDLSIMNGSSELGLPELPSSTDGLGILDALSSTYWGCWDDDITSLVEPQSTTTKTDNSSRP